MACVTVYTSASRECVRLYWCETVCWSRWLCAGTILVRSGSKCRVSRFRPTSWCSDAVQLCCLVEQMPAVRLSTSDGSSNPLKTSVAVSKSTVAGVLYLYRYSSRAAYTAARPCSQTVIIFCFVFLLLLKFFRSRIDPISILILLFFLGRRLQKSTRSVVSNRIGMKFGGIVLRVTTQQRFT